MTDKRYGATSDDWLNLDLLGLTTDLLPVVSNPNSPISSKSSLRQLGKVPSLYNKDRQIVGIQNWTQKKSTSKDIEKWMKEPDYGICIQTRYVRALDIDIEDKALAGKIIIWLTECFNKKIPYRFRRNSGKALFAFAICGEFPKRIMKVEGGIIEFLGHGQQFVAIGQHPSGACYEGLENVQEFPEIKIEEFNTLWDAMAEKFAIEPPSESNLRNVSSDSSDGVIAAMKDPVVAYLDARGQVTGLGKEGQVFIRCPFAHEHTDPNADGTSTAYLPAGHRNYEQGHFSCLHAHCHNRPDEDFLDAVGYRMADFEVITPGAEEEKKNERFEPVRGGAYSRQPSVKWLIKHILPERGAYQFYGGSGDGKTFVVLDMMLALCRGVDWNGYKVKKRCKVVYVCAEGQGGFISRLRAYAKHYDISDLDTLDFWVITDVPNFRTMEDVKLLAAKVNACGEIDACIIDTLAQVTPGADENAAKDMGLVLRHFAEFRKLTSSGSGIVHHSGKDPSKGARGSSILKGVLDAEFCIAKNDDGTRSFWVDKMKDDRDGFGFNFTLETVNFGMDEDNEIVSSCVVKYLGTTSSKKKKKITGYKGQKKAVLEAFEKLGGVSEHVDAVLKMALSKLVYDGKGKDRRRGMLIRAVQDLHDDGEWTVEGQIIKRDLKA